MGQSKKDLAAAGIDEEEAVRQQAEAPDQADLKAMSDQVGNAEMRERLQRAGTIRDELLSFVISRLQISRGVQLIEYSVMRDHNKWYRDVARGYDSAPDPRRWHRAARFYRRAILALSAGETAGAVHLIEAGVQAEIAAFDGLSSRVEGKLARGEEKPRARPRAMTQVSYFPTCTPTKIPEEIGIADRIEGMDPAIFQAMIRKGRRKSSPDDVWWKKTDEEVQDQEEQS